MKVVSCSKKLLVNLQKGKNMEETPSVGLTHQSKVHTGVFWWPS